MHAPPLLFCYNSNNLVRRIVIVVANIPTKGYHSHNNNIVCTLKTFFSYVCAGTLVLFFLSKARPDRALRICLKKYVVLKKSFLNVGISCTLHVQKVNSFCQEQIHRRILNLLLTNFQEEDSVWDLQSVRRRQGLAHHLQKYQPQQYPQ